jgi:hypothetical protein
MVQPPFAIPLPSKRHKQPLAFSVAGPSFVAAAKTAGATDKKTPANKKMRQADGVDTSL